MGEKAINESFETLGEDDDFRLVIELSKKKCLVLGGGNPNPNPQLYEVGFSTVK